MDDGDIEVVLIDVSDIPLAALDKLESGVLAESLRWVLDPAFRRGDEAITSWDSSI